MRKPGLKVLHHYITRQKIAVMPEAARRLARLAAIRATACR
jgi:hypothetical protein